MACDAPLSIKYDPPKPDGKGGFIYYFPGDCGKCLPCLGKRKSQWSYRLMEEKRNSFSAYFVTLTYKDEYLVPREAGNDALTKEHKDFIKWLKYYENQKRLDRREAISVAELSILQTKSQTVGKPLKYYGVVEFGDEKGRSHFHYLLFNVHDIDNIANAWAKQVRISKTDDQPAHYKPGFSKGKIEVDECNVNTVDYVLKYMVKVPEDYDEEQTEAKEKSYMSKGIGSSVVDPEFIRYIQRPEGNAVVNTRGFKISLPRYYNKKYLNEDERDQKGRYIRQEIEKKEAKEELKYMREGLNIYQSRVNQKESRFNQIKKRKKREIKDR